MDFLDAMMLYSILEFIECKKMFFKEITCTIIAALLGTPGGVLMFIPIYHPLHDIFNLHSEVTFFFLFSIFLLIIWTGDRVARTNQVSSSKMKIHWSSYLLLFHLFIHYASFVLFTLYFKPENEIAIGLGEPIGPCEEYVPIQTAFGMVLKKRKYLCATDYDEKYFDWNCLPDKKPPLQGSIWYTACGVKAPNIVELTSIAICFSIIAAVVYGNLHLNSFGDDVFGVVSKKSSTKDQNIKKKKNK